MVKSLRTFNWSIIIPPNTTASVYIPSGDKESITLNKMLLDNGHFSYSADQKTERMIITLGSASYNIVCN